MSDLGSKTSKYRKSAFVSAAGIDGLEIINTLPFEQEEDREDVDKILQLLDEHFLGAENVPYERFCFYQRNQKPDEDILTFIGDLRALSRTCKFVEQGKDFTAQMIRDRIICGMNDVSLRERLLSKKDISLEKCVAMCRGATTATSQARKMLSIERTIVKHVSATSNTYTRRSTSDQRQTKTSFRNECGNCGRSHEKGRCPAYGKLCNRCNKPNHFAIVCRSGRSENSTEYKRRKFVRMV